MRYESYQHSTAVQAYAYLSIPAFIVLMVFGFIPLAVLVALFNLVVLALGRSGLI